MVYNEKGGDFNMLDDKRILAIQLLIDNKLSKTEIAERCGRSRQWLYDILDEEEVKASLDEGLQKIRLFGESLIRSNLENSIANIVDLAHNAQSEKTRLDANIYLTNRILGTPTAKLDVKTEEKEEKTIDILGELEALENVKPIEIDFSEEIEAENLDN